MSILVSPSLEGDDSAKRRVCASVGGPIMCEECPAMHQDGCKVYF